MVYFKTSILRYITLLFLTSRSKREDIHPSKVEPIQQTAALYENQQQLRQLEELEGSIEKCRPILSTVTVTQTVTHTVADS